MNNRCNEKNIAFNRNTEKMNISAEKKKYYETAAVQAVVKLTDREITVDLLTECCKYLNRSYYKDVVTERSISSICGYPLCAKDLQTSRFSKQKYHISARLNKVYDVTDRKNFCSDQCFKSAKYLEVQLKSCPVWLHEDTDKPLTFKFLPHNVQQQCGILGDEIDFADKIVTNSIKTNNEDCNNSGVKADISQMKPSAQKDGETSEQLTFLEKNLPETNSHLKTQTETAALCREDDISSDGKCDLPRERDPVHKQQENNAIQNTGLEKVETALQEWITVDNNELGKDMNIESQNAIRRTIVLDKLNKVCPGLAAELQISSSVILDNIKPLLQTFMFSAHNISFRPNEWRLLFLTLLHMVSAKNDDLKEILDSQQTAQNETLQKMQLNFEVVQSAVDRLKNIGSTSNNFTAG